MYISILYTYIKPIKPNLELTLEMEPASQVNQIDKICRLLFYIYY